MSTAKDRGWGDPHSSGYSSHITSITAGGIHLTCRKEVAKLFTKLVNDVAKHYKLSTKADDWGYANRPIRGYEKQYQATHDPRYLSNHAWGLAIDLDASVNPMTTDHHAGHEFRGEVIHPLLVPYRGRIVWGGDYDSRRDYMHFEFVGSPEDAATLTRQMGL